jgi:hypothetical protein
MLEIRKMKVIFRQRQNLQNLGFFARGLATVPSSFSPRMRGTLPPGARITGRRSFLYDGPALPVLRVTLPRLSSWASADTSSFIVFPSGLRGGSKEAGDTPAPPSTFLALEATRGDFSSIGRSSSTFCIGGSP